MTGYRMYDEFAHLWPQISAPEEYAEEAQFWLNVLFRLLDRERGEFKPSVLELGVGGGNNLSHIRPFVRATAVDLSANMLEISRKLNPGVEHIVGDMRSVRLGRKFDAVFIHDAIAYMVTEDDLRRALETARVHLDPGGVFITGPDWMGGVSCFPDLTTKRGPAGRLSYAEYAHDPDPGDTEIEVIFTYFLPQPDGAIAVEVDRHSHGLFPLATWLRLLGEAGFETGVEAYPSGSPVCLITGIARQELTPS